MATRFGVLLSVLLALGLPATVGAQTVPLNLREGAGVERRAWPVTGGIPLPQGALSDHSAVRLVTPSQREAPLQTRALARWPDGSVKWLLLDFQADVPGRGEATYRLEIGRPATAQPKRPVRVVETRRRVEVDTGALKFVVSRHRYTVVDEVWLDVNGDGEYGDDERVASGIESVLNLIDVTGEKTGTYRTSLKTRDDHCPYVTVEEAGPLRAAVRIDGWHRREDGKRVFPLITRLHAYAGSTLLRVSHTFIVSEDPTTCFIGSIGLRVPMTLAEERWATIGAGDDPAPVEGEAAYLLQDHWNHYKVAKADGAAIAQGEQARGWAALGDRRWSLAIAVRDHWQQYPKELLVEKKAGALTAYFWPEHETPACDMRRTADQVLSEEFRRYLKTRGLSQDHERINRSHRRNEDSESAYGTAKTHDVMLYFGRNGDGQGPGDRAAAAFQEPLRPFANPDWYASSQALGRFHPYDPENFPVLEARQMALLESLIGHQTRWSHWYGIWNYGDFQTFPGQGHEWDGRWGWIQNELDMPQALILHYLRTGRADFWRAAESSARHISDVDTKHYTPSDARFDGVGLQRRHEVDHWSSWCEPGHTNVSGLIDYYFLTGERWPLEVAVKAVESELTSDAFFWREAFRDDYGRRFGNAISCAARVYEATGEERYRRWLDKIIDHYVVGQQETGEWRSPGGGSELWFTRTYVMRGLAEAYRMTGEQRIIEAIARYMDWETRGEVMTHGDYRPGYPGIAGPALAYWATGNVNYARKMLRELPVDLNVEAGPTLISTTHAISMSECPVLPYAMAALHDARERMGERYGELTPQQRRIGQAGEGQLIAPLPGTTFRTIDIAGAANADPARPFQVEPTQLGEKPLPLASFEQLPWGEIAEFAGVPFALGDRLVVLPAGGCVGIPLGLTARRLHVLGHVAGLQRMADQVGARYVVRYRSGEAQTVDLRNLRDYDYCRGPSWVEGRARWAPHWEDRLATHVNVFSVEVQPKPIESLELVDVMGQQLAIVAITAEVSSGS